VIPLGFKPKTFRTGIYAVETRMEPLPVGVSLFFIFSFDGNFADVSVFFLSNRNPLLLLVISSSNGKWIVAKGVFFLLFSEGST